MASHSSIYGIPRQKNSRSKEITSSSTLAFSSQLASLLAESSSSSKPTSTAARTRPSKNKPSIFTNHNRNTKKRALADISQGNESLVSFEQKHSTSLSDTVDASTLHRSRRKLEEKAQIYSSMKRGDYVPSRNSVTAAQREANLLVDFDRKWAEDVEAGRVHSDDSGSDSGASSAGEIVEYEDEFGRQRRGTRAEAAREKRRREAQAHAASELSQLSARPSAPSELIYGDTIQSGAFNPDAQIASQMENIAAKRDRSATPPEAVHYDATTEVRSKGVGFYAFSKDEGERMREMEELKKEREETEGRRREREIRAEQKRKAMEERRRMVEEKRRERLAERFLDELDVA